jgi:polyferredoxin
MERTYLTLTLDSAVIGALLIFFIFFGAFLLGLWCGRMWWGAARPRLRQ